MAAKNNPNELYLTRIYDAPVKTVWEAWTDVNQVAKWWGPRGFTLTTHSKDLRVGGHWNYTMHGPDGVNYPNNTVYYEVEKYKRLVYDHGGNADQPPMFRVTVEFSEIKGNKTKMEMTMGFKTAEIAKETKKFIKQANGDSTWDRLAEYLDQETLGKEVFVINRTFHTSIETMYEMWTNPKHFMQWLGPTGSTMEFIKADIKPGGTSTYRMDNNGMVMYGRINYIEMNRPDKLVYTQQFTDAQGKTSRHPMAPTWPETMLTTVKFSAEDEKHTRVTVVWEVHGQATREEMETFLMSRAGMTQGWTGSFDKLEDYLENSKL